MDLFFVHIQFINAVRFFFDNVKKKFEKLTKKKNNNESGTLSLQENFLPKFWLSYV